MPPGNHIASDSDLESVISIQELEKRERTLLDKIGPKYFCSIEGCDEVFTRQEHLDRHEFKHTGIKKHLCQYEGCDKSYSILAHLKRHIRATHERIVPRGTKTVPCRIESCSKMFANKSSMDKHVREVHENPKIYYCQYCNEKFTQRLKMRRHEVSQHTKDYPYKCEKCHRGFLLEYDYNRHKRVCKVYPCSDCSLEFNKWTAYLDHCRETKHGRKYYKCEHCDRVFVKPGELQNHIKMKHDDDMEKVVYCCPYDDCDRAYIHKRNLSQHIHSSHVGRKFKCTASAECKNTFSSYQNMEKHIVRVHSAESKNKKESNKKVVNARKTRRKRKDAGSSIMSNLAKLSNVAVSREMDKGLRARDAAALNAAMVELQEAQHQSETDDDEIDAKDNTKDSDSDEEMETSSEEAVATKNTVNEGDSCQQVPKEKPLDIEILNMNDAVKNKLGANPEVDDEIESGEVQAELEKLCAFDPINN